MEGALAPYRAAVDALEKASDADPERVKRTFWWSAYRGATVQLMKQAKIYLRERRNPVMERGYRRIRGRHRRGVWARQATLEPLQRTFRNLQQGAEHVRFRWP